MMRIKIEKSEYGVIHIELGQDGSKKPVAVTLTPAEIQSLIRIMEMALKAQVMKFSLELP
jgi:hypothetical protein